MSKGCLFLTFVLLCGCQSTPAIGSQSSWQSSCKTKIDFSKVEHKEQTQWFTNSNGPAQAVTLVIHGLNAKPSRMDQIVRTLNNKSVDVLRVALPGHRKELEEMRTVTSQQWLGSSLQAHCEAAKKAKELQLPLYFVGFSLGGGHCFSVTQRTRYLPPCSIQKIGSFCTGHHSSHPILFY